MSKIFTCCELVKAIKECQEAKKNNWSIMDKLTANEFLYKASWRTTEKIKSWANSEPVWTTDCDYLFCDECNEWFEQQGKLQHKLIKTQIEKEKGEGTFYSNPSTQKVLRENKEKLDKWEKELRLGNSELNFTKSPQE